MKINRERRLAVMDASRGAADPADRHPTLIAITEAIASQTDQPVRVAVRTHTALEDGAASILASAMEALSLPAFVCDRAGQVRALSSSASGLIQAARGLHLDRGRLCGDQPADTQALNDAIDTAVQGAAQPGTPLQRTVVMRATRSGAAPVVLDVIALPQRQCELDIAPRVLIVARTADPGERKATILRTTYSLTAAETDIAVQMAAGQTAEVIAATRSVSVGTVRAQIKAIMAKIGVRRQIELVARLSVL